MLWADVREGWARRLKRGEHTARHIAARYDRAADTGDGSTLQFLLPNHPAVTGSLSVYVGGAAQPAGSVAAGDE